MEEKRYLVGPGCKPKWVRGGGNFFYYIIKIRNLRTC